MWPNLWNLYHLHKRHIAKFELKLAKYIINYNIVIITLGIATSIINQIMVEIKLILLARDFVPQECS